MKKTLVTLLLLSLFVVSACKKAEPVMEPAEDPRDTEIEDLKQRIDELEEVKEEEVVEEEVVAEEKKVEKKDVSYNGPNFITLDSPANKATLREEPVIFKGSVSPNTTKVVVKGSGGDRNLSSEFPGVRYWEDIYTLKNFKKGDEIFSYRAKREYNNLNYGYNDYSFTAYFDDGTTKSTALSVFFQEAGAEMGKPVIYLYPEKVSKVSVNVEPTNGISISDPELGDGWNVIATPDSKIYNLADGKAYPYLFWEGFASNFVTPEEGFVMKANEVASFFDKKLRVLGLNKKEIADFKEYWVPILSEDPYYFITFIDQADFEEYAPLTVSPAPDSVIRVFFDYKGLEKPKKVAPQKLETPVREGFAVVEWGGRLYR